MEMKSNVFTEFFGKDYLDKDFEVSKNQVYDYFKHICKKARESKEYHIIDYMRPFSEYFKRLENSVNEINSDLELNLRKLHLIEEEFYAGYSLKGFKQLFRMFRLYNTFVFNFNNSKPFFSFPVRYKIADRVTNGESIKELSKELAEKTTMDIDDINGRPERRILLRSKITPNNYYVKYLEKFSNEELEIVAEQIKELLNDEEYKEKANNFISKILEREEEMVEERRRKLAN